MMVDKQKPKYKSGNCYPYNPEPNISNDSRRPVVIQELKDIIELLLTL